MARPKKHAEGLTKPVSFRLSQTDYDAYQVKFSASGLSQSDFFREHVLTNRTTVIARAKPSQDKRRLLYLFNKTGNNINQLAHRANSDYLAGTLTETTYEQILQSLEQISRFMKASLPNVE